MNFETTRTFKNLMAAYAGESQARVKYNIYANKAREEGYQQLGDFFDETSHNERAHAEMWLKYIKGGAIKTTNENLIDAKEGEHYEWTSMYKQFAEEAKQEGFTQIANDFALVAKVEEEHEKRYQKLLDVLNSGKVFKKDNSQAWICRNCGHIHDGTDAPAVCPVCKYPQSFFQIKAVNY